MAQVVWGPFGAQMEVKWLFTGIIREYTGTKHVPFDQGGAHVGDAHLCHGICPLKQQPKPRDYSGRLCMQLRPTRYRVRLLPNATGTPVLYALSIRGTSCSGGLDSHRIIRGYRQPSILKQINNCNI